MFLLQLPNELLLDILSNAGREFFRQNVSRLTVSRQWYGLAWQVMARDLLLTTTSLMKLTENEAALMRNRPRIATVELRFNGFEDSGLLTQTNRPAMEQDHITADIVDKWTTRLNSSLAKMCAALQQCPGLQCVTVKAAPEKYDIGLERLGYLTVEPLADLLSVCHLTSLELDIGGSYPLGQTSDPNTHFCRLINSQFPSLRKLRCRINTVCEHLLKPPNNEKPLRLKEVIVNLSVVKGGHDIKLYGYSGKCQPIPGEKPWPQMDAIESQAVKLASCLRNPRMVRIIYVYALIDSCPHAYDALTGQRFRLKRGAQWDADGELLGDGKY
ncbi:hypothetical protein F5X97DRAFT_338227 [Nemania serpens]|nr:hypothetical protein F5X97DRAFT_338227 [Nemania serpens]